MNVRLTPLSPKATNRLANSLDGNPICSLEQMRAGEIFVVSPDGRFCTWIALEGDPDWSFVFTRDEVAATPGSQPL